MYVEIHHPLVLELGLKLLFEVTSLVLLWGENRGKKLKEFSFEGKKRKKERRKSFVGLVNVILSILHDLKAEEYLGN